MPGKQPGLGLLGLFFFYFLDNWVCSMVNRIPGHMGTVLAVGLTMLYLVDFLYCLRIRLSGIETEEKEVVGRLKVY